jgi:hypothetical protein
MQRNAHVNTLVTPIAKQHEVVIDGRYTHGALLALDARPLVVTLAPIPQSVVKLQAVFVPAVAAQVARQQHFRNFDLAAERAVPATRKKERNLLIPGLFARVLTFRTHALHW